MKRTILLLCLVTALLVSCGGREAEALPLLEALMESCGELPAGQIYCQAAEEGMPSYLSDSRKLTLYGIDGIARLIKNIVAVEPRKQALFEHQAHGMCLLMEE